jgi:hypothetical protein
MMSAEKVLHIAAVFYGDLDRDETRRVRQKMQKIPTSTRRKICHYRGTRKKFEEK